MENKIIMVKNYVNKDNIATTSTISEPEPIIENDKVIHLNNKEVKINDIKIKVNRKIALTDKWKSTCLVIEGNDNNLKLDNHTQFILQTENINQLVQSQIRQKINGYGWQDIKKKKNCCNKFKDYDFVIELLKESQGLCFYCQRYVHLIYDYIREPKQWTIERIHKSMGHNKDNVVISCLNCNLRRRTMHYERYLLTKQLKINKTY